MFREESKSALIITPPTSKSPPPLLHGKHEIVRETHIETETETNVEIEETMTH